MTKSETPNHRDNWTTTEKMAITGMGIISTIELAIAYSNGVRPRTLSIIMLAGIAATMTLDARRWRQNARNWRWIARDDQTVTPRGDRDDV